MQATDVQHHPRWCVRMARVAAVCVTTVSASHAALDAAIDGISFAARPEVIYVPLLELCRQLDLAVVRDSKAGAIAIKGRALQSQPLAKLVDGTELVAVPDLIGIGLLIDSDASGAVFTIRSGGRVVAVENRPKRVEINLGTQQLQAWQGSRLVLRSRISSGRGGRTPTGNFRAGPYKARTHYSSLYANAPMPWSVQIHGHVFIHGFTSVPRYPASHGCIRLPLNEGNPARFFYQWVETGTPVNVIHQ